MGRHDLRLGRYPRTCSPQSGYRLLCACINSKHARGEETWKKSACTAGLTDTIHLCAGTPMPMGTRASLATGGSVTKHIQDQTRNVHGDAYPALCGIRVTRQHLAIKAPATCATCTDTIQSQGEKEK